MAKESELKKLKKWYAEELKRKDTLIEELKQQNTILMKASLNSSRKITELTEKIKKSIKHR